MLTITARVILNNNPDIVLHHMEDPCQDQLMSHFFAYFRVKKTKLGYEYENFIADVLEEGGTIVIVDCEKTWPVTKVADKHYFQTGAVGGIHPEGSATNCKLLICLLRVQRYE